MSAFIRKVAMGRTDVERILSAGLFAQGVRGRRGLPYVLVGKPGTAKTSSCEQISRNSGLAFESVVASLRDPSDFLGLGLPWKMPLTGANQHLSPDGDADMMVMKYAPPAFGIRAASAKRAVIMLDEVNTAAPSVQAALLRVLFEGVIGELELPSTVRFLLAMNATEDAAGGWDIAPPLANRVGWLQWSAPSSARFAEFLMSTVTNNQDAPLNAAQEEAEVDALWNGVHAKTVGTVAGFLAAKADMLFQMPPAGTPAASSAWPSPRTWELASRARTIGEIYDLSAREISTSIGAFIGTGATAEMMAWEKHSDLPDPVDFLDGNVAFTHKAARLDRTAAVLTSATAVLTSMPANDPKLKTRAETLWSFHKDLAGVAPDLALGSVFALCKARLMLGSMTAYQVLAKMEPVMAAAGITPSKS